MKRNKLIAMSAIMVTLVTVIAIKTGFGRSKVLIEIEAYERGEATAQQKPASVEPTTVTHSESPSVDTRVTSPETTSRERKVTALDIATIEAQECFREAAARRVDQHVCVPHLERMEEAARTGR
jgi:hypothetical protein